MKAGRCAQGGPQLKSTCINASDIFNLFNNKLEGRAKTTLKGSIFTLIVSNNLRCV